MEPHNFWTGLLIKKFFFNVNQPLHVFFPGSAIVYIYIINRVMIAMIEDKHNRTRNTKASHVYHICRNLLMLSET